MIVLILVVWFGASADAWAAGESDRACPDAPLEFATVAAVGTDLTMTLADGRIVGLPGLESPRATQAGPDRAERVRARLATELQGQTIGLASLGAAGRWKQIPSVIFTDRGTLAELLLESGDVRVRPDRIAHPCFTNLLAAETRAREARLGVWSDTSLVPLDAGGDLPKAPIDGLAIVEGAVASAAETPTRLYLNLGRSRGGFAISVPKRDIVLMQSDAVKQARRIGTRVRVRGLVDRFVGWRIDVSDADAIELLPPVAAAPATGAR